jgi:hypothetical protein
VVIWTRQWEQPVCLCGIASEASDLADYDWQALWCAFMGSAWPDIDLVFTTQGPGIARASEALTSGRG